MQAHVRMHSMGSFVPDGVKDPYAGLVQARGCHQA